LDSPEVAKIFPIDVQERAKHLLSDVGSVGAYSHSKGAASIRKDVAAFIESELLGGKAVGKTECLLIVAFFSLSQREMAMLQIQR